LVIVQSVCRTQDITSNITSATDTTNYLVQSEPTLNSNDTDYKSSDDHSADDYFSSLAFRNNTIDEYQYSFHRNTLAPIQLSHESEKKINGLNVTSFQMIDGTYWRDKSELNYGKLFTSFGAIAAADLIAYQYASEVWYKDETTGFHTLDFNKDMKKWQYMDKMGHFTTSFFVSDLTSKLYRWSGISGTSSVWYGALTGWLWMLQIEISDGFMKNWGFSWGDLLANTIGSGYFVLQQFNYELLGGITPKFSYKVSTAKKNGDYVIPPESFIQDYEGMTFWLTVNIHHYIPEKWKEGYPEWLAPLGIAFGYSAKDLAGNLWTGKKEFFIGMDIDIRKIPILDDWGLFRFIKSELNFIRLPLPTIRISQSGVWYGIYF
jgi:Predicted periplasmic lipoprotein (DUF2279)